MGGSDAQSTLYMELVHTNKLMAISSSPFLSFICFLLQNQSTLLMTVAQVASQDFQVCCSVTSLDTAQTA